MRQRILDLLRAQAFVPFRIELSSGAMHVVRHPDQVMLVGALIFVGVPQGDAPGPEYVDVAIISHLHVTKLEVMQATNPAG